MEFVISPDIFDIKAICDLFGTPTEILLTVKDKPSIFHVDDKI